MLKEQKENRLAYLDNLRIVLAVMVLMSHLAITYGPAGIWYYYERSSLASTYVLAFFLSLMQAFLMGLFFLISGYFSARSLERKDAGRYLLERLKRLGLPLLFYVMVVSPLVLFLHRWFIEGARINFFAFYLEEVLRGGHIDIGPLWFVQALLFFSLAYGITDRFIKRDRLKRPGDALPFSARRLFRMILLLGAATFLVRIVFPIGTALSNLQIGLSPQYIFLFAMGIAGYKDGWLERITKKDALTAGSISLAAVLAWPLVMSEFSKGGSFELYAGGFNPYSLMYSLWEASLAICAPIFLLYYSRKKIDLKNHFLKGLSRTTYSFYLVHTPVIILLAYSLRDISIHPLLKFLSAAAAGIPLSFLAGSILRRLPLLRRVL
jgi:glucans biosynthesis protein C